MRQLLTGFMCLLTAAASAGAAELRPPAQVTAGTAFSIPAGGSGKATFYLYGPAQVSKRELDLGSEIQVQAEEVERAGLYTAILCGSSGPCSSANFYVRPGEPDRLTLLVHPSRVPVSSANAISAVAVVFDALHNMVLTPVPVKFNVSPKEGASISQTRNSSNGIAWIRMTSAPKGGPAKLEAVIGKTSEVRVVQQVASDACNLNIRGGWVARRFTVETAPVRDCTGNFVPDGTVVSFTKIDDSGKTTVDVPIKRGIAKVEMPVSGRARITAASGVASGNELSVGGAR